MRSLPNTMMIAISLNDHRYLSIATISITKNYDWPSWQIITSITIQYVFRGFIEKIMKVHQLPSFPSPTTKAHQTHAESFTKQHCASAAAWSQICSLQVFFVMKHPGSLREKMMCLLKEHHEVPHSKELSSGSMLKIHDTILVVCDFM